MKILIIGTGGIGSFLIRELNRLILNEQISLDENSITIMDFDEVEVKNLKYQNFEASDIGKNKAEVLGERYLFDYKKEKLTKPEQLKGYDFIMPCVDNTKARKLIFEYCEANDIYFIDARAEGRAIAIFTKNKKNTMKELLKTLNLKSKESKSCQLGYELEKNIIQQGNLIVATITSQLILNKLRGEINLPRYNFMF